MTKEEVMGIAERAFDAAAAKPLDGKLGLCAACEAAARAEAIAGTGAGVALCPACEKLVREVVERQSGPLYPLSVTFKDGSLHVSKDQTGKAASLTKGSRITVRGRVSGLMMNVLVKECEIL